MPIYISNEMINIIILSYGLVFFHILIVPHFVHLVTALYYFVSRINLYASCASFALHKYQIA